MFTLLAERYERGSVLLTRGRVPQSAFYCAILNNFSLSFFSALVFGVLVRYAQGESRAPELAPQPRGRRVVDLDGLGRLRLACADVKLCDTEMRQGHLFQHHPLDGISRVAGFLQHLLQEHLV